MAALKGDKTLAELSQQYQQWKKQFQQQAELAFTKRATVNSGDNSKTKELWKEEYKRWGVFY